jgi:CxxC motif-containing protein (DUF1111 family)
MSSDIRSRVRSQAKLLAVCSGVLISGAVGAGCATEPGVDEEIAFNSTEQDLTAVAGDPLPGITAAAFAEAKDAFVTVEGLDDGLGPIFNEKACGNCHTQGAIGGAGVQIERRFGRIDSTGRFDDLANKGGSLRQLFTVGSFTGSGGQACRAPLEVEPPETTIHNVGRLTTPLFGAGLIDAIPDSVIAANAAAQPSSVRGIISRVPVLLGNPSDPAQAIGTIRTGRFGWKAGIASLTQFSADAYVNEMGITTQHCVNGASIMTFGGESKPNGIAQPAGCDDRGPGGPGVPAGVDDGVGSCAGGLTEIQEDVELFADFMTFLAPAPRLAIDPAINLRGGTAFNNVGCAACHLLKDYVTPSHPANGVPGNFTFRPRSDFLLHDVGGLGDGIGNKGDSVATTKLMRTAPLWGLHHRTRFLHDGRAATIEDAIHAHGGQAAASVRAFDSLSSGDRSAMLTAMKSD